MTLTPGGVRPPSQVRGTEPGPCTLALEQGERRVHYHLEGPGPRAPGAAAPCDSSQTLQKHMRRREASRGRPRSRGHSRKAGPTTQTRTGRTAVSNPESRNSRDLALGTGSEQGYVLPLPRQWALRARAPAPAPACGRPANEVLQASVSARLWAGAPWG